MLFKDYVEVSAVLRYLLHKFFNITILNIIQVIGKDE